MWHCQCHNGYFRHTWFVLSFKFCRTQLGCAHDMPNECTLHVKNLTIFLVRNRSLAVRSVEPSPWGGVRKWRGQNAKSVCEGCPSRQARSKSGEIHSLHRQNVRMIHPSLTWLRSKSFRTSRKHMVFSPSFQSIAHRR